MARIKMKKQEIRKDPIREFLAKAFAEIEGSIERYFKYYVIGFLIIALLLFGVFKYFVYLNEKREKNSLLISKILEISQAPVVVSDDKEAENYKKSGITFFSKEEEKIKELIKKIDELLSSNPLRNQKDLALFIKSSALVSQKQYDEALKILSEIKGNEMLKSDILLLKARIYELKGDDSNTLKTLEDLKNVKGIPQQLVLKLIGEFYERNNNKKMAIEYYEKALKSGEKFKEENKDKKNTQLFAALGAQYYRENVFEEEIRNKLKELKQ